MLHKVIMFFKIFLLLVVVYRLILFHQFFSYVKFFIFLVKTELSAID